MAAEGWWDQVLAVLRAVLPLIGVVLGFVLSQLREYCVQRRRRRAHWAALKVEIEHCGRTAGGYVQDNVMAPLYRLPTVAYTKSFPALLADGVVEEAETKYIISFFSQVETLNRGLDQAQSARGPEDKLKEEYCRNVIKAKKLRECSTLYEEAHKVVTAHL